MSDHRSRQAAEDRSSVEIGDPVTTAARGQHVLILGGGYVGLYTALQLQKKLRRGEARITLVDPRSYMTYQPFLPEAAAGSLEPRHVVVSLRRELRGVEVITGRVSRVDHERRTATVLRDAGAPMTLHYDQVVVAVGSIARTLPIPGLTDIGIGFKHVEEAIALRNHVLDRLDVAANLDDPGLRARALTFVFVGGGYAGIEALAELEDMARAAVMFHDGLAAEDLRFVLVEASRRILPEVGEDMGRYTLKQLRERGIDIRLETRLESCTDGNIVLSDGTTMRADTLVWTAGVRPSPVLADTDLPVDDRGRLRCAADLRVQGPHGIVAGAWGAGDCAAVPDLTSLRGDLCSPSAQHAVRQARRLGDNIVSVLRGQEPSVYKHRHVGSVASLGLHKGVAQVYGLKLKGRAAWFMHRTYHMSRMPTLNRKVRIILDWTLALFFQRELVALGRLQNPRAEFRSSAQEPNS